MGTNVRKLVLCLWVLACLCLQPVHAETLMACAMEIEYKIQAPPPGTPANIIAFQGVWVGQWDPFPFPGSTVPVRDHHCTGLIVE
jgi:hypothetical protein